MARIVDTAVTTFNDVAWFTIFVDNGWMQWYLECIQTEYQSKPNKWKPNCSLQIVLQCHAQVPAAIPDQAIMVQGIQVD